MENSSRLKIKENSIAEVKDEAYKKKENWRKKGICW